MGFVFSDGHGLAMYTEWFDALEQLKEVDWNIVYQRYWRDRPTDMDRQRRKQSELLVYRFCPWPSIQSIAVIDARMKQQVERILTRFAPIPACPVRVEREWYYW